MPIQRIKYYVLISAHPIKHRGWRKSVKRRATALSLSKISKKRKTAVKNWPRKVQQCRGRWKIGLFFCIFCLFLVVTQSFLQIKSVRNGWNWFCCRVFPHCMQNLWEKTVFLFSAFLLLKIFWIENPVWLRRMLPPPEWIGSFWVRFLVLLLSIHGLFCFARSACVKPGFFCHILMYDIHFCTDSRHSFRTDMLSDL